MITTTYLALGGRPISRLVVSLRRATHGCLLSKFDSLVAERQCLPGMLWQTAAQTMFRATADQCLMSATQASACQGRRMRCCSSWMAPQVCPRLPVHARFEKTLRAPIFTYAL